MAEVGGAGQKDIYELLRGMMKDLLQLLINLLFWEENLLSWNFNVIFSKRHGWWNTHQMRSNIGILRWEIFSVRSASHFKTVKITVPGNSGELINSPVHLVKNAKVLENISVDTQRVDRCDQEGYVPNEFLMKWLQNVGITSHNFILFRNCLAS